MNADPGGLAGARARVLFLCSGSVAHGLGHVTRTRSVAARLAGAGATGRVVAIGDDSLMNALLDGRGIDVVTVDSQEAAVDRVIEFAPDVTVFDLLHFEKKLFDRIAGSRTTVSLSPVFDRLWDVDVVYHRTSVVGDDWSIGAPPPRLECGLEFAVIGDNCRRIEETTYERNIAGDRLSVAVAMGGTDAVNKTLQVIGVLRKVSAPLLVWVLLGEGYAHSYQDLVDSVRGSRHEIILAKTSDSMWRVMNQASVAVVASGITIYEATYSGLPTISMLENRRGRFLIEELVREGVCTCAGNTWSESLDSLGATIVALDENRPALLAKHRRCKKLIDGGGAERIARGLERMARIAASNGGATTTS